MKPPERIAIVYNEPQPSCYDIAGEAQAALEVLGTVGAVRDALLGLGHNVSIMPLASLDALSAILPALDADLVFNLFEGFCGHPETEALVPEILEDTGIPYTGCSAPALRLALNKAAAKRALMAAGIPTPAFQLLTPETISEFDLGYPAIVKPLHEDASHGLSADSVVKDVTGLSRQLHKVCRTYGSAALVEEFIGGRELNATVLVNGGSTVLPVSEITYDLPGGLPEILTFAAKWQPESPYYRGTQPVCPAGLPITIYQEATATARRAFELLGDGRGYARVDMRLDATGRCHVLEINPNPDITPGSGAVLQAATAGMDYPRFLTKIITAAVERNGR